MNRKEILGSMLKEGTLLVRNILFPAPWMARKLFFLWWLTMERDLENPEDKKEFSDWLRVREEKALSTASVTIGLLLCVGCVLVGSLLMWYESALQPGALPWLSIWLSLWGVCSGAHAITTIA